MKAKLILLNWGLSLCAVGCVDMECSPLWAVLLLLAWFAVSSLLLKYADWRGWLTGIVKRYKLDEL
jgi:hypothetical protein